MMYEPLISFLLPLSEGLLEGIKGGRSHLSELETRQTTIRRLNASTTKTT
jgi:hypothetical protein